MYIMQEKKTILTRKQAYFFVYIHKFYNEHLTLTHIHAYNTEYS